MHHNQSSVGPLFLGTVCLDDVIDSENHCGKDEGNEDAVVGLEIFDDDLARLEDEVVLHLPHGPPAADDKAVDNEVAKYRVQYNVSWGSGYGFTEVTAGGEDFCDGVSDNGDGGPRCTFKCIHGEKREGGQEEDGEELVPEHAGEDDIENVETPSPEDHPKESIVVYDDNLGNCLNHSISISNFFL